MKVEITWIYYYDHGEYEPDENAEIRKFDDWEEIFEAIRAIECDGSSKVTKIQIM